MGSGLGKVNKNALSSENVQKRTFGMVGVSVVQIAYRREAKGGKTRINAWEMESR